MPAGNPGARRRPGAVASPREDPAEAREPSGGQHAGAIPREPPDLLPGRTCWLSWTGPTHV